MATSYEIKCINKTNHYDAHERISNIGGVHNGTAWKKSVSNAIKEIEEGNSTFYVNRFGNKVNVIIAKTSAGNKYLKTESDNTETNNLLELPECN